MDNSNIFISVTLLAGAAFGIAYGDDSRPMSLVYDHPAKVWESEALPIGNGHMGAMIFGGVRRERIQTNEKTLWSGGPGEDSLYNGGHLRTPEENHAALQAFRRDLQERMKRFDNSAYEKSGDWRDAASYDNAGVYDDKWQGDYDGKNYVNLMLGTKGHFGTFQTLSDIIIEDPSAPEDDFENLSANYSRGLNLDNATQWVEYGSDGNKVRRTYFMSYPDNVMVVYITADHPFTRRISIDQKHSDYNLTVGDGSIVFTGWPTPVNGVKRRENDDWKNGLKFAQVLSVHDTDGDVSADGNSLVVENARNLTLVMSAATNYQPCYDDSFNYFSDEDPLAVVNDRVEKAKASSYDELLKHHIDDYTALFNRNSINLGGSVCSEMTTDSLLKGYAEGTLSDVDARFLETLYYQFGRYLLIGSSRPGSLPANLQGVWGERMANPWNADYHTNINVQMNYWPAEPTNLAECHIPMVEFVKSLEPRGSITARHYHCRPDGGDVRGWTAYHEVNAWGNTAPAQNGTHSMFPEGAAWICQDIWEYYQFTQDEEFLKEYYPTMKNAALFWVDNLWEDERDHTLVANPSLSPEHGAFSLGCTASQGVIYELFDAVEKAAKVLGLSEDSEVKEIAEAKSRLSMPKIGKGGQFMEWKDEVMSDLTGEGQWNEEEGRFVNTHRHTNHLFWLHPGSQVVPGRSQRENEFVDAMKVTLNTRGDEGTGWSRAWKLNFWARLRDGNRAHGLLRSCLNPTRPGTSVGGVFSNLFDAHPPFQIDGNFGYTSGVAEMLLQSQGDMIELLPALPDEWHTGAFDGMCARGGYVVDAEWQDGKVKRAVIGSKTGRPCIVRFPGASKAKVRSARRKVLSDDTIELVIPAGASATLTVK